MQNGRLTERITIEYPTLSRGPSGGQSKTWQVLAKDVAASRRDYSGNEKPATGIAGGEVATARVEFTVHWRPDITSLMRVRHSTELCNIRHVNNFAGRRESLILTCDTGVNDG